MVANVASLRKLYLFGSPKNDAHQPDPLDGNAYFQQLEAIAGASEITGTWDASAGSFPGSGAADFPDAYLVTTAGTVDGVTFNVADIIVAITTNASASTFTGNWLRIPAGLDPVVSGDDSGAGTPNAIEVTTDGPIASDGGQLITFNAFEANTGSPVTVEFNDDGSVYTIKTASGSDIAIGGIIADYPVTGQIVGSNFVLLSDQASSAIQTAAEAAQSAAEDARDAALAAVPNAFPATIAALKALDTSTITSAYLKQDGRQGQFVFRSGDYSAEITADTTEAIYIKATDTASSAGAWVRQGGWHVNGRISAKWAGVLGTYLADSHDDSAALEDACELADFMGVPWVELPPGIYGIDDQVVIPKNVGIIGPGLCIGTRWDTANTQWVHGHGAVFAITHDAGSGNYTEANATFSISTGGGIKGCGFWYPNQPMHNISAVVEYSPTIGLYADTAAASNIVTGPFVEDCYATNPYHFVSMTILHGKVRLYNLHYTFMYRGVLIDNATDVDRLIDLHTNPNMGYVKDWPADDGVIQTQYDNDAISVEIAKADQPYLDRVFSWGGYYGLVLSNLGNGATNGLRMGLCGFEGCQQPVLISAVSNDIRFGKAVFGTYTSISGYAGASAVTISPPSGQYATNIDLSEIRVFQSIGPAVAANRVRGLTMNRAQLLQVETAGGFLRGAVEMTDCSKVNVSDNEIGVTGSDISYMSLDNVRGFTINDNFVAGMANGGTAWAGVSNSSGGLVTNNRQEASSTSAAAFTSSNTGVTVDALGSYTN